MSIGTPLAPPPLEDEDLSVMQSNHSESPKLSAHEFHPERRRSCTNIFYSVYVGNLPPRAQEKHLMQEFSHLPSFVNVRLFKHKSTGVSHHAFVDFSTVEAAATAAQTKDLYLHGNKLFVTLSNNVLQQSKSVKGKQRAKNRGVEPWRREEHNASCVLQKYLDSIEDDSKREKVVSALSAAALRLPELVELIGGEGPVYLDSSSIQQRPIRSLSQFWRERESDNDRSNPVEDDQNEEEDVDDFNCSFDSTGGEYEEIEEPEMNDSSCKSETSDSSIHMPSEGINEASFSSSSHFPVNDVEVISDKSDLNKSSSDCNSRSSLLLEEMNVPTSTMKISPFARLKAIWEDLNTSEQPSAHEGCRDSGSLTPETAKESQTDTSMQSDGVEENCRSSTMFTPPKGETKKTTSKRTSRKKVKLAVSFSGSRQNNETAHLQEQSSTVEKDTVEAATVKVESEQVRCDPSVSPKDTSTSRCESEAVSMPNLPPKLQEELSLWTRSLADPVTSEADELSEGHNCNHFAELKEFEPSSEDLGVQAVKPLSEVLDDEDDSSLFSGLARISSLQLDIIHCQDEAKWNEQEWQSIMDRWIKEVTCEPHDIEEINMLRESQTIPNRLREQRLKQDLLQVVS